MILEHKGLAKKFAKELKQGTTLCLRGELAAGKTTFTQGLAAFFRIPRLVSPTFIIMRQYPVTSHPVIKTLNHLDLYRLNSVEEIKAFDVEEIWSDPSNLLIIEWPEKFVDILPHKRIDIFLKATTDDEREIKIITHW